MAYRITGTDPFVRCSIGAFNGWQHNQAYSVAALIKRIGVSSWAGIHVVDNGSTTNFAYPLEINPSNQLAVDFTTANPFNSTATFNNTTNWMIVGLTWNGGTGAGSVNFRYNITGWGSESASNGGSNATAAGSGYRHIIGNEAGLLDDASYDIACIGAIRSELSQGTFESLDKSSFDTWKSVFTGSNAWLIGFDDISTRTDVTGNGGNEVSRSAGITLQADPSPSFFRLPPVEASYKQFPKYVLRSAA